MGFITLRTYEAGHLAHLDRAKLADEGINAFVTDDNTASVLPYLVQALGRVKLQVHENDVEKANKILGGNEYSELSKIDADVEPQTSCPYCGSIEVSQHRSMLSGFFFLVFFFLPVALFSGKYLCGSCGKTWKSVGRRP